MLGASPLLTVAYSREIRAAPYPRRHYRPAGAQKYSPACENRDGDQPPSSGRRLALIVGSAVTAPRRGNVRQFARKPEQLLMKPAYGIYSAN